MRRQFAIFSLMVLVLSVGGVVALLRVSVVAPVRQLVEYVDAVTTGRAGPEPPPLSTSELASVARAFADLKRRLDASATHSG